MNSMCCLSPSSRVDLCRSPPIGATKRSARIAKRRSMHQSHHNKAAITNYFQVQTKLPVSAVQNRGSHGQSDGMDTTDDSDPSPPVQDDDDNACDYAIAFGQHFQPLIRDTFTMNNKNKQTVTTDHLTGPDKCRSALGLYLPHDNAVVRVDAANGEAADGDADDDADDDDSSSNSSDEPNIFLQKPVLHLDIDRSLNQPSSIVIKKHLEIGPNLASALKFVTNSKITAKRAVDLASSKVMTNNFFRNATIASVSNNGVVKHKAKRKQKLKPIAGSFIDALNSSDSNSCDSGVVADRTPDAVSTTAKPTTPHRIVCTSTTRSQTKSSSQRYTQKAITNFANFKRINQTNAGEIFPEPATANDYKSERRIIDTANEKSVKLLTVPPRDHDNMMNETAENGTNQNRTVAGAHTVRPLSPKTTSAAPKQMTDFFPVRRSVRKTKRAVEQENLRHIERAIERKSEDGLVVKLFKDKGRGIIAGRPFARGEFVVEYIGDLIDQAEADRRERIYAKDAKFGCYMYYFKHKEHQWCIDATAETGNLGRLVNHSRNGNLTTKTVTYKGRPHLVLLAKEDIKEGEELTYDYGDRTRESLINHPWLAL